MPRLDADIQHVGVFGRRLSGKTTLVIELLKQWHRAEGRYGVVLDPKAQQHNWGAHCWVTKEREQWLAKWQDPRCRFCNVVWEETSTTLKRDADLVDVFTAKAGEHAHRLIVTGHTGMALLPVMRWQIGELFLFRPAEDEAEEWSRIFMDRRISTLAASLDFQRREFLHVRMGQPPRKCRLVLS